MKELPRIARINAAMSQRLERMIRKEFDALSPYDFDGETEIMILIDKLSERLPESNYRLNNLRVEIEKDSRIPNEKRS